MHILLFGSDGERLKAAATKLRSEGHTVHLRNPRGFRTGELETSYDAVLLLEPADVVRGAYEAFNTRAEQLGQPQIRVEERLDFNPPTARELDSMSGKPHWPDMSVKELIEYALVNYDKKVLGRTKAEIIQAVDLLWRKANSKPASSAEGGESSLSIPIGR